MLRQWKGKANTYVVTQSSMALSEYERDLRLQQMLSVHVQVS